MLQRLQDRHPDPRYRAAIGALAAQLAKHPRTSEGAFWHKQRYPHQLWLDGVYMGMPFLAGVGVAEGDDHKVEEAVREFTIARSHLRDARSGLYYHAWDEAKKQNWADPETGRSRFFWGRGLGWYAMALVDILDVIPPEKTELRAPLLEIIPELAESLVRHQDATGVWFQILDMPAEPGNYREASASAMFTYFLAKAVNKGYLPASFEPAARKAYAGLVDEFVSVHADGSFHLTNVVEVGGLGYGRDGSYRYYMSERVIDNDPKGVGPAIMAGLQVAELATDGHVSARTSMAFAGFDLTGRVAIVLGGTSGIGRALVDGLVEAGADVAASSRRQAEVDATALAIERHGKRTLRHRQRRHRPRLPGSAPRGRGRGLRQDRHPDQLRRTHPAPPDARGRRRRVAGDPRHQPDRHASRLPGLRRPHARARLRPHRQHRLAGVFRRPLRGRRVRRQQGRRGGADQGARRRVGIRGACWSTPSRRESSARRSTRTCSTAPNAARSSSSAPPSRRFGRVDELAGAAVFLASEAASFVNGEVLVVDGGFLASGVNQ